MHLTGTCSYRPEPVHLAECVSRPIPGLFIQVSTYHCKKKTANQSVGVLGLANEAEDQKVFVLFQSSTRPPIHIFYGHYG